MGTNYEVPHDVAFSVVPLFHSTFVQIFSSAPCSQTPSAYPPLLVVETKFHTHTK
jgi:hypothetical protein